MADKNDYFSREQRLVRRARRLGDLENISESITKHAKSKSKINAQNAGTQSVKLVRELLDQFRLPTSPKLGYSGVRNVHTAAGSTNLEDGVVTIHAHLRTFSGVNVDFDVPVEIRHGELLEPSIIVHDGLPRVIAQSTFDEIVKDNTFYEEPPLRTMYAPPMNKDHLRALNKNRLKMERMNLGMFSASKDKLALIAAMRGTAQSIPREELENMSNSEMIKRLNIDPQWLHDEPEAVDESMLVNIDHDSIPRNFEKTHPSIPSKIPEKEGTPDMPWALEVNNVRDHGAGVKEYWFTDGAHAMSDGQTVEVFEPSGEPAGKFDINVPNQYTDAISKHMLDLNPPQEEQASKQGQYEYNKFEKDTEHGLKNIREEHNKGKFNPHDPLSSPKRDVLDHPDETNMPWEEDLDLEAAGEGFGYGTTYNDMSNAMQKRNPKNPQQVKTDIVPPQKSAPLTPRERDWSGVADKQAQYKDPDDLDDLYPDPARNQQDDDLLDPAERKFQHDLFPGQEVTVKQTLEVKDRGGVTYTINKGSKCTIMRDHAGDNKSFAVNFGDGLEAIVERHFLKSAFVKDAQFWRKLFGPKKHPQQKTDQQLLEQTFKSVQPKAKQPLPNVGKAPALGSYKDELARGMTQQNKKVPTYKQVSPQKSAPMTSEEADWSHVGKKSKDVKQTPPKPSKQPKPDKDTKPLFKLKKSPKACSKCNSSPCKCHKKKSELFTLKKKPN